MQPHQLEYFLAVAETGSFTRGAERVGVVQSAVSAAIAQLERQLRTPLLERAYHRVTLTAAGEALLPHARNVLADIEAGRDAVASARGEVSGTVLLGTLAFTGPWDVADLLRDFQGRYPLVAVHLRQTIAGSATSLAEVRSGALDLALVSTQAESLPGLRLDEIHREPMVFACAREHPLARRSAVSILDLVDLPFIDYPTGWGNRTVVDLAFAAAGAARAIRTEVTDFRLARALVGRDLGVTIVPVSAVDESIAHIPLREPLEWSVKLARPAGRRPSQATARLADAILDPYSALRPTSRGLE
ncbi:LysR family transcriptional regulator [Nocardioides sp. CER19]|uniref:LysR family transcriptional regulator n=1 Tax=Nocardioides sp. CER19 TaxID=3038538 RepID=UPI002449EF59|nr:LysR family transcriptional regulator [Nocardioides sp. CER19]MDH2413859.1 LysR family transcriptional regulator [Nocardioides sp. CER19]